MTARVDLDPARCYRAFVSHDRRFDGRLFGGVVTTGIYCRPICPVRPAKLENSRFFVCAAAAEAAGFRPCRRCRPETSPGTPAWLGTSAVVSRAFRLISEGALDEEAIERFSARVGLSGRQLRRLFQRQLGASPAQIARARRIHFARGLIDETRLPMTAVALSAGFGSVRQFNYAVRRTFGEAPSALRRRRHGAPASDGSGLLLRLPYRPPLAWGSLLAFLRARATPGVEVVEDDAYRRTIELMGVVGTIEVRADAHEPHLLLRVRLPSYDGLMQIVERAGRLFDLGADPYEIASRLRRSPFLRPLAERTPGMRVPGAWDAFELAVRAALGEQMTGRAATTLCGRLVRTFGEAVGGSNDGLSHLFPNPARLADADLARVGIPRARAATIRALAAAVTRGAPVLDAGRGLDDALARFTAVPGLDPATAHYIAMRALGEPDAFPSTDLGLRRAAGNATHPSSAAALEHIVEPCRPWRAYAAMYLGTVASEGTVR